jgi:uncharacterized protein
MTELMRNEPGAVSSNEALRQLSDDLRRPAPRPMPKQGAFDPQLLAIVTTRGCNINCSYCDFGGPQSEKVHMDPALAVHAIDWMADHLVARGRRDFLLHLFGGEPFISGDLIDIIVHRTRAVCARSGLRPHIDVSTNGVFPESRAAWIGEYFSSVVLSLDGPPELQNRTRPGNGARPTFEHVDRTARRLRDSNVELCLRVCVTRDSVQRMPEITSWMASEYSPHIINFEPLTENELTAEAGVGASDPFEFARAWLAAKEVADQVGVRLVYSATEEVAPRLSACPVGHDAVVITPDGTINGCYLQPTDWKKRGMDMHLGKMTAENGPSVDPLRVEHLRTLVVDKPRCRECFCQWSCAGGCHVSNTYDGCSSDYIDFCMQTRLITACLLLDELGETAIKRALLNDRVAMLRLATHRVDAFAPEGVAPL